MGGLYNENITPWGFPFQRGRASGGRHFASAPADTLMVFYWEILKMFVVCSLTILILAFAAVYFI